MERFLGALSLTILLSGVTALAQVNPSDAPVASRDPIQEIMQAGLAHPNGGELQTDVFLSRAELAKILVRAFQLDRRQSNSSAVIQLQDVPPSHWAYQEIQLVLHHGIMEGYREGRFFPDQRVTRAEAFSIFAQANGIFQFPEQTITEVLAKYPDAAEIPDWARKPMATALAEGFVNLDSERQIRPLHPMTRGDMAYALQHYLLRQATPSNFLWNSTGSLKDWKFTGSLAEIQQNFSFL